MSSFDKKFKRNKTVKQVKDMTMEEKKEHLLKKQSSDRRARRVADMTRHWLKVRDENSNKIALAIANSLFPMWYILAADRVIYGISCSWIIKGVEKQIGDAWFIKLLFMPMNILSLLLSLIFLKPIHLLRLSLVNFGLSYQDEQVNAIVTIRRIYKFGKLIDETRWE